MSDAIRQLEPIEIWSNFADLNAVPRPSKKEERVISFIKTFGAFLDLETFEDEVGNVIIKKPATPGMEDRKTVVCNRTWIWCTKKMQTPTLIFLLKGFKCTLMAIG